MQVDVGHAPAEQWVSLAEVVVDVETGEHGGDALARFVHGEQLGELGAERVVAVVGRGERDLRHRVLQHPGGDGVSFGVVRVQEAFGRDPVDDLGEFPSEVDGVLHAGVETLAAVRGVDVGGVAGEQHSPGAVGRRLAAGVGEA